MTTLKQTTTITLNYTYRVTSKVTKLRLQMPIVNKQAQRTLRNCKSNDTVEYIIHIQFMQLFSVIQVHRSQLKANNFLLVII